MKADDAAPDVPPASLNPEKDPDEWVTKDEAMTGPQRSYLQTLCREAGEEFNEILPKRKLRKRSESCSRRLGGARAVRPTASQPRIEKFPGHRRFREYLL
jgi:hypothetical protein